MLVCPPGSSSDFYCLQVVDLWQYVLYGKRQEYSPIPSNKSIVSLTNVLKLVHAWAWLGETIWNRSRLVSNLPIHFRGKTGENPVKRILYETLFVQTLSRFHTLPFFRMGASPMSDEETLQFQIFILHFFNDTLTLLYFREVVFYRDRTLNSTLV
jgi:hypothetical protein